MVREKKWERGSERYDESKRGRGERKGKKKRERRGKWKETEMESPRKEDGRRGELPVILRLF